VERVLAREDAAIIQAVVDAMNGSRPADPGLIEQLDGLFAATGHDGIALWGSVGDFAGEDANATEVQAYLEEYWGPHVEKHCRTAG